MANVADYTKCDPDQQTRLDDELQALEAIFPDSDLQDLRKLESWTTWRPPEFTAKLYPTNVNPVTDKVHVAVEVHINLPTSYPNQPPFIEFINTKGIAKTDLEPLNERLNKIAADRKGQEMLFEMFIAVQEFLVDKNKPPAYQSFYDGMVQHQEQLKLSALDAQQLEELKKRKIENQDVKEIEAELQRREKLRRETLHRRHPQLVSGEILSEPTDSDEWVMSSIREVNELSQSRSECSSVDIDFASLRRCRELKQPDNSCAEYLGILGSSLQCVIISDWTIKITKKSDENEEFDVKKILLQKLEILKAEIAEISKFDCEYLLNYFALDVSLFGSQCIEVTLLKENNFSMPVSRFLERGAEIPVGVMKKLMHDILSALDYLHSLHVSHDCIHVGCLWESIDAFLLSDCKAFRRLKLLKSFAEKEDWTISQLNSEWKLKENFKVRKRSDIRMFGVCLLELARGSSGGKLDLSNVPKSFGEEFNELLAHMIEIRPASVWSADRLLQHSFFYVDHPASVLAHEEELEDRYPGVEDDQPDVLQHGIASKRLDTEFQVLKSLGRGGFGDVWKVRNKLDDCVYAIKRVPLNPQNKALNKKIMREVKLLSQLNHENVVRYYNSWIEETPLIPSQENERSDTADTDVQAAGTADSDPFLKKLDRVPELTSAAAPRSVEWSYSAWSKRDDEGNEDDSSEEDAAAGSLFDDGVSFADAPKSESVMVIFQRGADEQAESSDCQELAGNSASRKGVTDQQSVLSPIRTAQLLYIQMEFCEKSTLKLAIDRQEIFKDSRRAWRLFRETLEGLQYIHSQGTIHRDLKPANIFLDSLDHVKIGDFGLAITGVPEADAASSAQQSVDVALPHSADVGTYLYASPEVQTSNPSYSQKVDIYSLGIIFFEMFYPMGTTMERVRTLDRLRRKTIEMPESFQSSPSKSRHVQLLQLMLIHEPNKRPTAEELLKSTLLPLIEIKLTDFERNIKKAMSDTLSRHYKYLIHAAINQLPKTVQDCLYDEEVYKAPFQGDLCVLRQNVRRAVVNVFLSHGAMRLDTNLLMPKRRCFAEVRNRVQLMTRSGIVVYLPFALRVPFARFVARNHIMHMKRFSIARVFRERKMFDTQPREFVECAFDVVTGAANCPTAIAELLSVLFDLVNRFPALKSLNFYIKMNHTDLIKIVLRALGIANENSQQGVIDMLCSLRPREDRLYMTLGRLTFSDEVIRKLFDFLRIRGSFQQVKDELAEYSRQKQVELDVDAVLHEFSSIMRCANILGVRLPIEFDLGLMLGEYSGIIFQVVSKRMVKRHKMTYAETLATGGRYDSLIDGFRKPGESGEPIPAAVGISVAFDVIVFACAMTDRDQEMELFKTYDVLICSVGQKDLLFEKLELVKQVRGSGILCDYLYDPVQDVEDLIAFCKASCIPYLVLLKEDDAGYVRLKLIEKDRLNERKLSLTEVAQFIREKMNAEMSTKSDVAVIPGRSGSSFSEAPASSLTQNLANLNIRFVSVTKLAYNTKKRYESQISKVLMNTVQKFSHRQKIEVVATVLPRDVVQSLVGCIDLRDEHEFQQSFQELFGHFKKYKKHLSLISDSLKELCFTQRCPVIYIYSYADDFFRLIG